uniref:Uncharacterized protein n=2 Tax=Xiphophorus couchianus TaxID=32473 RepID=A0A3B5KWG5_9TELE
MLLLDPEERVTAVESLSLPYFAVFREPAEETDAQPYDNSHEDKELTLDQWKRCAFTEILSFQRTMLDAKETPL